MITLSAKCFAAWVGLAAFAVCAQTNSALPDPALPPEIKELVRHADAGEAGAQYDLGLKYAEGTVVPQDLATAAAWLRKAAEQGDARAQLRLGTSYLEGKGVTKNMDEAIKWLYKAAAHDTNQANGSPPTTTGGAAIKQIVTLDGRTFDRVSVQRVDPDGVLITYAFGKGGFGMAKIDFKDLSAGMRKSFGYDEQVEAAYLTQQKAMEEIQYAEQAKNVLEQNARASERMAAMTDIVAEYHRTHTYMTNESGDSIYVCGDMACDIWNMAVSRKITAKIVVGDVDKDITSLAQARHAWVVAEVSGGQWIGLECTGGYLVRPAENKRYFFGCRFSTPKEYRDFEQLKRQYNTAVTKGRAAQEAYNNLANSYRSGNAGVKGLLQQQMAVVNDRLAELQQFKTQLDTYHMTED